MAVGTYDHSLEEKSGANVSWGAILAVPTVVFSMYGMNFQIMPELNQKFGYPLVVGGTALACALLYRRLVRAGWI